MITWAPSYKADGIRVLDVPTAWNGLEFVIPVLVDDFGINRNLALEFGVDYGFSTSAFANVFKYVVGVDTFAGDPHAGWRGDSEEMFRAVQDNMKQFPNVILLKETWERFAEK